jgi:Family of unknown function (DUF5681)
MNKNKHISNESPHSDSIGYRRPPKNRQFQPGESGNPSGRPRGTRNFKTDLREELSEIIAFREGDREVSISKQRALIKRLITSAINGDARAIATVMSFCARAFGDEGDDQQLAPEDREIVQAFARRSTRRRSKIEGTTNSPRSEPS